jgi:hypothetical protein
MRQLSRRGFSILAIEIKSMWDNGNHRLAIHRDQDFPFSWYLKFSREFFKEAGNFVPELKDQKAESLDLLAWQKLQQEPIEKDGLLILFAHPDKILYCSYDTFNSNKKEYTDQICVRRYLIAEKHLRVW